ncbi:hypothetical protein BST27_09960 [Mycobacterium intermedium]|uniref:Uncharacterized protein n=1 Tax=Mycobacterium intermedium TaxID=28445 RepID=A0A1T3W2K9_MYCIE|nr:hypothetical protein [Mycobacterium intermedium]MCV6966830.1 hypothetical protein [Mycobacterium intermedium]OPE48605.1 hypothetical protein BV508_17460 [Mycobacterium intermedium]ORB07236.1 hypothetical protein BST27_09960 [Mycobacterium intermedium]
MKTTVAAAMLGGLITTGVLGAGVLAPRAQANFMFEICPSGADGVVAGTPTSCAFADNVRRAYVSQGSTYVLAYSPVTGRAYMMDCSYSNFVAHFNDGTWHPGVLCEGGIGAAVVIW